MILKFNLKKFLISILIPLAVGGLSAFITRNDMDIYKDINRPPFSPPSVLFPVAWTILYILLGISFYLVWNTDYRESKSKAYFFFTLGLILNFIWSPVFFSARLYFVALIILLLLLITIVLMFAEFHKVSELAAYLQIPYLLWLLFAGYLNIGIYLLNR